MSKKKGPSKEAIEKVSALFGGMAASNAIGQALQMAAENGYKGIMITFIKEESE